MEIKEEKETRHTYTDVKVCIKLKLCTMNMEE